MKKRVISMLLVLCMAINLFPLQIFATDNNVQGTLNPFSDVSKTDWYYDSVMYAYQNKLFSGTDESSFSPDGTMTRAMYVTVLGRMAGIDLNMYRKAPGFIDIAADSYYAPYVQWAVEKGITSGIGDGLFDPDGFVTRQQMATLIVRFFDAYQITYPGIVNLTTPADIDQVADWAKEAVMKLWACGLFVGDSEGNFGPLNNATRAEGATFLKRTDTHLIKTGFKKDPFKVEEKPKEEPKNTGGGGGSGSGGSSGGDEKTYTVTFLDGDRQIDKISVVSGNPLGTLPSAEKTAKEKEVFVGWFTDEALTTPFNSGSPVTSNMRVYAKYTALPDETYTVTFLDGDRFIDNIIVAKDKPLGTVPSAEKTAKENAIFVGWFTNEALTTPFYSDNPVTSNMTVYAKYAALPGETLTITSFAQLDQSPDLSFEVEKTAKAIVSPDNAFTLIPKDGSDPVPLKWTTEGNLYTITADGGFNEGCSYELTLADGYNFKNKPDSIRTASFTIKMDKIDNLQMNDEIAYIKDTPEIDYIVNGKEYEVLTPSLVTENGGEFNYSDADSLQENDILCFYITTSPEDRDYINNSYNNDPEVYAKVESISGSTVTFGALDEEDMEILYKVPDNFPMIVSELPSEDTGTVNISDLDIDTYALIMGEDGTLNNAKKSINVGDFISLYVSADSVTSEDAVYFGEVTAYDKSSGTITYKRTTAQAIEDSMDLYITPEVSGDDLITAEEKAAIESQLFKQVEASNFAHDAASMLADMATDTNGFRNMDNVQSVFFKDENGNPLSEEEIALLNIGGAFELTDDIKLTVELVTKGDQLHFDNGVQLAIGIDATFEVETEDGGKIVIDLSAVFVEEVALGINVKGDLVWKKVLGFIPIPIGVSVNSAVDIKNFSAVSFNVNIYTVAEEDQPFWEKLKGLLADSEVGNVLGQIEELQNKIDQAKGTAEQLRGYAQDLEDLWEAMPENGTSKEEWAELGEALGKTNITKDLLDMMNLTTETNLEAGIYAKSMQDLMEKYSEMLQKETDWVKLVDEEMFGYEMCFYGIAIKASVNFVVRADLNISMGTNLEYEVGKRYTFWFKIGLFKPKAGSETMDLIDERFAFQFYVMGKMGLKMGAAATIEVGIGSTEFASVGITAELGPYVKLYGFFVYEYEKMKPANTKTWVYEERMAGALFMEFGLYFILTVDAHAIGDLFEYSHDFYDIEIPLLEAGKKRYPYAFAYKPEEGEQVRITDEDGDSSNGVTMKLPDSLRALSYVDLDTGILGSEPYDFEKYNITFSNPNFSIDENGVVSVDVPEGVQYMECDATITWLYDKLAFSQFDMSVTIPLVWTNLSTAELNEYFTASVRVGNDQDGYQTIWSKRVKKNQEFDFPTIETIKELINYGKYDNGSGSNMKYASISDYGSKDTENVKIYTDTVYDIEATYKDYSITVSGIEQANGKKTSKTYTAKYGEAFDFSDLAATGTNKPSDRPEDAVFTKFASLTAEKAPEDIGNGELSIYDLTAPIEGKYALALTANKVNPVASYVDDSVLATFQFDGITHENVIQKLKKGTGPDLSVIEEIVADQGLAIKDLTPVLGKLYASTNFSVICGELTGPKTTIFFEENGGNEVNDITKVTGSLIGTLPTPTNEGYTFDGWYSDEDLTTAFTANKMPSENITLYAKWMVNTYSVTLNANGGTFDGDESTKNISVTYSSPYGELAAPTRSGKGFSGWFTALEGGKEVKSDTTVETAGNHTLYAHWTDLESIGTDVFGFSTVTATYEKGKEVPAIYDKSEDYAEIDGFTFEYRKQGDSDAVIDIPVGAGTYDMVVKRAKDNTYAQFEHRYEGVVRISKATRTLNEVPLEANEIGYTFLDLQPAENVIDDLSDRAKFTYNAMKKVGGLLLPGETANSNPGESYIGGLMPATEYYITVTVINDPNYEDAKSNKGFVLSTLEAPTTSWADYTEPFESGPNFTVTISTPGQLAAYAQKINSGEYASGGTKVILANDLDFTGHKWTPIGVPNLPYYGKYSGTFDGNGHTISGLYVDGGNNAGLFGYTYMPTVKNVILEDSYIKGNSNVGGIAGYSDYGKYVDCINKATVVGTSNVGGIVGMQEHQSATIENCVNYGRIRGADKVGGIVGYSKTKKDWINILNCVNYGPVIGTGGDVHIGGIAGYQENGTLLNSANFGFVKGDSAVGGVIGQNENSDSRVLNSYSLGTVEGVGKYIGGVVGRNTDNDGKILQCYYLAGSAKCNGSNRNGVGTEKGSLNDGEKSTQVASFTSEKSALSRNCGYGTGNLITALNSYVDGNSQSGAIDWVVGANKYPVPRSLSQS